MQGPATWCRVDTTTREGIDALVAELARSPLAGRMSLLDDPRWLAALADEPGKGVRAYAWRSGTELVGYVGYLVHPSAVRLALGEFTLFSRPVRRLWGLANPIFAPNLTSGEERDAIEDIYEPYLIQIGFLDRTPRGRVATPRAFAYFGLAAPGKDQKLWE